MAERPERERRPVETEAPRALVPEPRDHVSPVLDDQPECRPTGKSRRQRVAHDSECGSDGEADEDQEAEVPLVHAEIAEIQAEPELMALDSDQPAAPAGRRVSSSSRH